MTQEPDISRGLDARHRATAAELYDDAFGDKLGPGIRDREARLALLAEGFDGSYAITAVAEGELVGLAGFHDSDGSLTGPITFGLLRRHLGLVRSIRALAVLGLLDRKPASNELLMDGIAVASTHRGQGIGSKLFAELESEARQRGFGQIRLDVIDTNPAARRLYERLGFEATKTEKVPFLQPIMGFGAATTLVKQLTRR